MSIRWPDPEARGLNSSDLLESPEVNHCCPAQTYSQPHSSPSQERGCEQWGGGAGVACQGQPKQYFLPFMKSGIQIYSGQGGQPSSTCLSDPRGRKLGQGPIPGIPNHPGVRCIRFANSPEVRPVLKPAFVPLPSFTILVFLLNLI